MWIIQNKVFGEEQERLLSALIDLGIEARIVNDDYSSFSSGTEKAIFRGSVDFVKSNSIGLINLKNYNCSMYYAHYLDHLLNHDFIFINWGSFGLYKDHLFRYLNTDELFIRPNSGRKIFTGNYVTKKWFNKDIEAIMSLPGNSEPEPDDLIVASSKKKLLDEFRVLMYKKTAIDCTVYYTDEDCILSKRYICKSAEKIAAEVNWYPDDFYVMDLTYDINTRDLKIIEINNLFSSGWYNCDYEKVIKYIEEKK